MCRSNECKNTVPTQATGRFTGGATLQQWEIYRVSNSPTIMGDGQLEVKM